MKTRKRKLMLQGIYYLKVIDKSVMILLERRTIQVDELWKIVNVKELVFYNLLIDLQSSGAIYWDKMKNCVTITEKGIIELGNYKPSLLNCSFCLWLIKIIGLTLLQS